MSRFGVLLRDARRRAGYTQETLAEVSGVGVRTIRRLETGGNARIGTVTLLADALELSADERRRFLAAVDGPGPLPGETPNGTPKDDPSHPLFGNLPLVPREVTDAADHLAQAIEVRLRREEEVRRVHDPFPLPVRWRQAQERFGDHWDNVCRVPAGVNATALDLSGDVGDIAATYRRVPSRRMVVLGRAGSGKTVLTSRFIRDTLARRPPGDAVPVVFNIGSWDPAAKPLRTWLVDLLLRDHPGLSATAPGGATLAAVLVDTERILPVLDGFDEITEGLRRPALQALNTSRMPLLLTSRPSEYERAVTAVDVLTSAAVVELTDLTPDDLAGYLPRTAPPITSTKDESIKDGPATVWDSVIDALRGRSEQSSVNVATVLQTPLMVGLARAVYSDSPDRDPAELLDRNRFPTPESIEEHLLDKFVPTVYGELATGAEDKRWEVDRVRHWLGYLADGLDRRGTGDLEWSRMGSKPSLATRVLLVMVVMGGCAALASWAIFPAVRALFGMPVSAGLVLRDGLVMAPAIAVSCGLLTLLTRVRKRHAPRPMHARLGHVEKSGHRAGFRRGVGRRFLLGMLAGAMSGVGCTVWSLAAEVPWRGWDPGAPAGSILNRALIEAVVLAIVFGVPCGIMLAYAAVRELPVNLTTVPSPADSLVDNRTMVLRGAGVCLIGMTFLIAVLGLGVMSVLEAVLPPPWTLVWDFRTGLVLGAMIGFYVSLGWVVMFTAWGHWLVLTRLRLPVLGRLPWSVGIFLDDAYRRGVLRQSGAVYQFRHARLQEHLAKSYRRL